MTSIRQRTLTLILGLLFLGLLIMTAVNLHDSNHEIDEVYDAQLAQNARLLQGVMRMPMASKEQAELYQAFNQALGLAVPKVEAIRMKARSRSRSGTRTARCWFTPPAHPRLPHHRARPVSAPSRTSTTEHGARLSWRMRNII